MTVSWTDFTSADYGVGARLSDSLFQKLADNDIAGAERVFQLEFDTGLGASPPYPTFTTQFERDLYIPPWAKVLRLYFDALILSGAGTMHVKGTLGGSIDSNDFTSAPGVGVLVNPLLTFTDISSFRDSIRHLEIKLATTSATLVQLSSTNYLTNRFSLD